MAGYRENKNRELCVKKKKNFGGGGVLISLCLPKVQGQVQLEN